MGLGCMKMESKESVKMTIGAEPEVSANTPVMRIISRLRKGGVLRGGTATTDSMTKSALTPLPPACHHAEASITND